MALTTPQAHRFFPPPAPGASAARARGKTGRPSDPWRKAALFAGIAAAAAGLSWLLPGQNIFLLPGADFSLARGLNVDPAMIAGVFLGIITASFMYLLMTWFAIRDRSQVYLMLMVLCLMAHIAADSGYIDAATGRGLFAAFLKEEALLLFYLFSSIFTILYLELDAITAHIRYALFAVIGLLAIGLVLTAIDLNFFRPFLPFAGLFALFIILVAGLNAVFLHVGGSSAHVLAFAIVFLGTLGDMPHLRAGGGGGDFRMLAYALCAMLFSVVIAGQFARRQETKERELALSNERFRMAALGSNEGLYDLDLARGESYVSDRFRRILGANLAAQKKPVRYWLNMLHDGDRRRVRRILAGFRAGRNRLTLTFDCRVTRPDLRVVWISVTGVAVRDESGNIVRLIGSIGDITEKKRAEMRLRASEARFRSITEAHPVPVLIATLRDGHVLYASQGAEAALRAPLHAIVSHPLDLWFEQKDFGAGLMREVMTQGHVDLKETSLRRADGALFAAALSARPIHYERRACVVLGLYDISARKAAEARVKETEAALQQSEKLAALGGLLAGVAHELNNPLSVIVGQAALLKESAPEPRVVQRADKIRTAGERCSRIVRSFLALARRKPTERKATAINTLIEESLELLAFQLRTDNVELRRKLDPTVPLALADPDQMIQVITNLVINAKQALADRPAPHVVEVETWHRDAQGGADETVFVAVTDNGPGVPKDIITRIFEPFFTTKPAGSGTGVGLSLCHNIIDTHGGRIWVENAPAGGARFIFTLPVSRDGFARENMDAMVETVAGTVPPQRILIVDDELELGQTLADILAPDGHMTTLAENGKKALEALKHRDFDLIISDLRMPVMDGPSLYRELEKQMPRYAERILFVTGDTLSIAVREFLNATGLDVIEKPYSPEEVRRALVLHMRGGRRAKPTG